MLAKRTDAVYTMTEIAASDSIKEQLWPKQGWTNKQTVEKEKKKKNTLSNVSGCVESSGASKEWPWSVAEMYSSLHYDQRKESDSSLPFIEKHNAEG